MVKFDQTRLPGVGIRHDFVTQSGRRIGVITRHTGRRELLVYSDDDPDTAVAQIHLEEADRQALLELFGGSQVTETLGDLQQRVEGLAIDWLTIAGGWSAAGLTIADTQMRRRTGVSIVALLRGAQTVPAPEPSQPLAEGDTVVVVGTPQGIEAASVILRVG